MPSGTSSAMMSTRVPPPTAATCQVMVMVPSDERVEDAEGAVPFARRNASFTGIENLEGLGKGDADPAEHHRQPILRLLAERVAERRPCGQVVEDRAELDVLVELAEFVHGLLQARGEGQVGGLDNVAAVRRRGCLPGKQQVIDRLVDEVQVAL